MELYFSATLGHALFQDVSSQMTPERTLWWHDQLPTQVNNFSGIMWTGIQGLLPIKSIQTIKNEAGYCGCRLSMS